MGFKCGRSNSKSAAGSDASKRFGDWIVLASMTHSLAIEAGARERLSATDARKLVSDRMIIGTRMPDSEHKAGAVAEYRSAKPEKMFDAWACLLPEQQASFSRTLLAERLLRAAARGERDPEQLRARALFA